MSNTSISRQKKLKDYIKDASIFKGSDLHNLNEGRKYLFFGNDKADKIDIDFQIFIADFINYTKNVYAKISKENQNSENSEFDIKSYDYILLQNFNFSKHIQIDDSLKIDLRFENCTFNITPFNYGSLYEFKIKFRNCTFDVLKVNNVDFRDYLEFFDCKFKNHTIFEKCNFYKNVTFTKSHFMHNMFFTYSSFYKHLVFNRAKFGNKKKPIGLDLSQSIINGTISFFMVDLYSYPSISVDLHSKTYDNFVKHGTYIPFQNKRETFRIIKQHLIQQNNLIEAEKYAKLEKQTFLEETNATKSSNHVILLFNRISNNFKTDYRNGISFTVLSLLVFTFLTFITSYEFWFRLCFECDFDLDTFNYAVKQLFVNLNPTHSFDYIDKLKPIYGLPYLFDFLGRISIGYGIYQTIQAFRKFK